MSKQINDLELSVQKLMKFMQYESEKHGDLALEVIFNFSPKYLPKQIPAGDDLLALCNQGKLNQESVITAINTSLARKFISRSPYYPNLSIEKENPERSIYMRMTDSGYKYALSIDSSVIKTEIKGGKGHKDYIAEKKKGGSNSHSKNAPLRSKVKELCRQELETKSYPSALKLAEFLSTVMVKNYPELLESFEPYKRFKRDGVDWLKPTFYDWCNTVFKELKGNE